MIRKLIICIAVLVGFCPMAWGTVDDVPNPKTYDADNWVSDPDHILDSETKNKINDGWGWMLLLLFFSVMCLLGFSGFVVYLLEMNSEKLKKYDEQDRRRSFRPVDMNNHEKGGTI